jgi:hypothetical protein
MSLFLSGAGCKETSGDPSELSRLLVPKKNAKIEKISWSRSEASQPPALFFSLGRLLISKTLVVASFSFAVFKD